PHQSLWNNLLLARRPARHARRRRATHAFARHDLHLARPRGAAPCRAHSGAFALLALRRRGVGRRLHCRLHGGKVNNMADHIQREQAPANAAAIQLPAPTSWPMILAFGCTLAAASLVTDAGIGMLGGVLMLFGCIGWFRHV